MFTGIIEDIGLIAAIDRMAGRWEFAVRTGLSTAEIREGDSLAVDGVCLTVTRVERDACYADASLETLNVTTLSGKSVNDRVNLERAMRVDSRLGGHIVMPKNEIKNVGTVAVIRDTEENIPGLWKPPVK